MQAILLLTIAAILWGLNFHFIKFILEESTYAEAGFWRYALSSFAIGAMAIRLIKKSLFSIGILLVGIIGLFGFNLTVFIGMADTSAINASLIMSLNPITTIILSHWILKTEARWYHFVGAIISFWGVGLLLSQGNISNLSSLKLNVGDLWIFTGNLVFAFYHIWVKQYIGKSSNLEFTLYTSLVCMLCFIVLSSLLPSANIRLDHSPQYWIWSVLLGVLGTAVSFLMWNRGVTIIGADKAGIFMNIVPLATSVSALFFGLKIYPYHLYCGSIIIAGIIFTQLFDSFNRRKTGKIAKD